MPITSLFYLFKSSSRTSVPGQSLLALWRHRAKTRRQMERELLAAPEQMLQDLGLDHDAVRREIEKPFWRP